MEDSIKRAEKLVHATNSALAQMKYSLTFDKAGKKEGERARRSQNVRRVDKGNKPFSLGPEWDNFEKEFRADADEILSKMDKILDPSQFISSRLKSTKAFNARKKMNEINRIIATRSSDFPKSPETNESRQKLLTLINDEESSPRGRLPPSTKTSRTNKEHSLSQTFTKGANTHENPKYQNHPKEDLKMNLLQTEEIVERGFHTARQLTERMDNIRKGERKKRSSSAKSDVISTSDVINIQNSNETRKSDSNETIKTISSQKCPKCQRLKKKKERDVECALEEKPEPERNQLLQVKSGLGDSRGNKKTTRLSLYQLPSVHIRGDLQVQRIHSLALPGHSPQGPPAKPNTSIEMLSHEDLERGKTQTLMAGIKKANCFCSKVEDNLHRIECFNCGNLIRIPTIRPDPEQVDRLLLECNFNVFDPRIDEFVEKWRETGNWTEPKETPPLEKPKQPKTPPWEEKLPPSLSPEKVRRNLQIRELSHRLARRYKEELDLLEDDHQQFQNILKALFKRIDDSRKFFNFDTGSPPRSKCGTEVTQKRTNLTATKPFLVCLSEEKKERMEVPTETRENLTKTDETPRERRFRLRQRRKKLDKNDLNGKWKTTTPKELAHEQLIPIGNENGKEKDQQEQQPFKASIQPPPRLTVIGEDILREMYKERDTDEEGSHKKESYSGDNEKREKHGPETQKDEKYKRERRKEETHKEDRHKAIEKEGSVKSSGSNSAPHSPDNFKEGDTIECIASDLETNTDNDYESDFERESPTFGKALEVAEPDLREEVQEFSLIPCVKKLSTITEVDSDLEKKFTEESSASSQTSLNELSDSKGSQIDDILAKAFKKGIEYTLQRQTNVLDSMGPDKPETIGHLTPTPPFKTGNEPQEETGNSSRSPCERPKSSKSKSEASQSQKSSPTDVVASLKEVLSALKDQFARTQSLADKLTDSVKAANEGPPVEEGHQKREIMKSNSVITELAVNPGSLGTDSCLNKPTVMYNSFPQTKSPKVLVEEEVSIGEVCQEDLFLPSERFKMGQGKSKGTDGSSVGEDAGLTGLVSAASRDVDGHILWPSFAPASGREEKSFSEGEIVSNIVPEEGGSSMQSIGELISESLSEA